MMGGRGGAGGGGGGRGISDAKMHDMYGKVQESWGGATVNQVTGKEVPQGADKYAVATTATTTLPENATYDQFKSAVDNVVSQGNSKYVGVFHDDVKGTIDINGATVTTKAGVDRLYAAGNPVTGGAYHFATGEGYWPQGRPAQY
jgi:hypothetical protein